ncbi:MAG TPA: hypothetical protein VF668_05505 [Pyrinomonadaceae bacterium]
MGWIFVICTTLLLGLGVAFTVLWFWQAGARMGRVGREEAGESRGRSAER